MLVRLFGITPILPKHPLTLRHWIDCKFGKMTSKCPSVQAESPSSKKTRLANWQNFPARASISSVVHSNDVPIFTWLRFRACKLVLRHNIRVWISSNPKLERTSFLMLDIVPSVRRALHLSVIRFIPSQTNFVLVLSRNCSCWLIALASCPCRSSLLPSRILGWWKYPQNSGLACDHQQHIIQAQGTNTASFCSMHFQCWWMKINVLA